MRIQIMHWMAKLLRLAIRIDGLPYGASLPKRFCKYWSDPGLRLCQAAVRSDTLNENPHLSTKPGQVHFTAD